MTHYEGSVFGFNYSVECKDDAEFEEWLYQKLRRYHFLPVILKVLDRLLNDTATIQTLKETKT